MKIRLVNFRCYEDSVFSFDNITLVTAPSGSGKSSILLGIQYCLFGTKTKGSKLVQYGKTYCSVEMEIHSMVIKRTSKPGRLVLTDGNGSSYEDDEAQAIVDRIFGTDFMITSFITQNPINSFIMMSPIDKLVFLEKFAFKDMDISDLKMKCKKLITDRSNELLKIQSQKELLESIMENTKPPSVVKFPAKVRVEDRHKFITRENTRLKNTEIKIKRTCASIGKIEHDSQTLNFILESLEKYKSSLLVSENELKNIEKEILENRYLGDSNLEVLRNRLDCAKKARLYSNLRAEYESRQKDFEIMKDREDKIREEKREDLLQNLSSIKLSLESKYDLEEGLDCIRESLTYTLDLVSNIQSIMSELSDIELKDFSLIENNIEKLNISLEKHRKSLSCKANETYECPCCKSILLFKDNILEQTDNVRVQDVESEEMLKKKIFLLQKELEIELQYQAENTVMNRKKTKLECKLKNLISEYDEHLSVEKVYEIIEDEILSLKLDLKNVEKAIDLESEIKNNSTYIYSQSVLFLEKELGRIKSKISAINDMKEILTSDDNEEELLQAIHEQEKLQLSLNFLLTEKSKINKKIYTLQEDIKIKEDKKLLYIHDPSEKEILEAELRRLNIDIEIIRDCLLKIDEFLKAEESIKTYNNIKTSLETVTKDEITCIKKLNAAKNFKDHITKAESIAISHIIESINLHTQIYLDAFFSENPINVQIKNFKETKKTEKPEINIEVFYKNEINDISSLSGGELSRIILAFTLALCEISSSPLLLLDECTSSLDQELTNQVFEVVKEHCKSKICIVVAHQVVEGIFDSTLRL